MIDFERYNIELKKNKKKWNPVIAGLVFVAVLILIIAGTELVTGVSGKKTDTSEGLAMIQEAESADVAGIETKIQKLEAKESSGKEDERSLKERFASVVVLGDAITEGFLEYDVLNASSVISGAGLKWEEQVARLKEVNPKVVFLTYCADDILKSEGDVKAYAKDYRKRVEEVQKAVPGASVFVNSFLAVKKSAVDAEAQYKKLDDYNEALQKLCDKMQIGFVDNSALKVQQYYEEDGVHFNSEFYPVWAERMSEVASL